MNIYIALITAVRPQRRFWFDQLQEKRQVLRKDNGADRLEYKLEARVEGGRRFQGEESITVKDLHLSLALGVLRRSCVAK